MQSAMDGCASVGSAAASVPRQPLDAVRPHRIADPLPGDARSTAADAVGAAGSVERPQLSAHSADRGVGSNMQPRAAGGSADSPSYPQLIARNQQWVHVRARCCRFWCLCANASLSHIGITWAQALSQLHCKNLSDIEQLLGAIAEAEVRLPVLQFAART